MYRSTCRKIGLKLATLNANDLRSKIGQIRQLVATRKIDIFAIYDSGGSRRKSDRGSTLFLWVLHSKCGRDGCG